MSTPSDFLDALHNIGDRVNDDMSEKDVENAFLNENFYTLLDYEGAGHDLRSEMTLPDNKRPDYLTLDDNESVTAVYEFKSSGRDLDEHTDQLFHYVNELKSDYGVLTNGEKLRLYRRDESHLSTIVLGEATDKQARDAFKALQKPEWDITNTESVDNYLNRLDPVTLDGELGREHFFDTFRLEEGSVFADLVTAMMDLLHELRDDKEAKFVEGAFDFWEASYANIPENTPDSWEPMLPSNRQSDLKDFMFCLESGHALLGRLLLSKAAQDYDFFKQTQYEGMDDYFTGLSGFSSDIDPESYPVAAASLIEDMQEQLVESLFEDDIFTWWKESYRTALATGHGSGATRFKEVAEEGTDTELSEATRERFSRAISHTLFAVLKFDFEKISGDPLGNLYQRYFDPETRKALGEFYTPEPVVDYIMDGVDYNVGVSSQRVIDPACGSGTFLVEAIERYIEDVRRYDDNPDWTEELTELCTHPHVVGVDIHPFAVLMAQIRFMVAILPEYREAKQQDHEFTIRRLPIFRADTLRDERDLTGADLGDAEGRQMTWDAMTEDNQDVRVPVPLPIEVDDDAATPGVETDDGFLVKRIRMPLFDTIRLETGVSNFGEYFAALQGVLDVVKWHMEEGYWEYQGGLASGIERYTSQEYDGVEEFFSPYVDDMLEVSRQLQENHDDGRLFKMFEDTVLALVVKNYMDYDYVVGNPPYVRVQNLPDSQKHMMESLYSSTTGNYDIYCPFYERGLDWLQEGTGKLGFITPNQFMVTEYGEGLRQVMLDESRIKEMYDFRDSGVFEDATNYPAIVILEDEPGEDAREDNEIRCVRVKANTDDESDRELDEEIIKAVRDQRGNPGYSDEFIDVFDYPQGALAGEEYWPLMPPEELEVFEKLEQHADTTIGDATDAVFQGIRTSANKIYVVDVLDADRVESNDTGDVVTIVPTGESKEYEIETDLLRPFLKGNDVKRWRGEWSGLHVIYPYHVQQANDGGKEAVLYGEDELRDELPLSWEYLQKHETDLREREDGSWLDSDVWWEFGRTQNLEKFETPKTIQAEIADDATFMVDETGTWYFTTAYGVTFSEEYRNITEILSTQLNSKVLDFYLKHIAAIKAGGYYSYRTQYVEKLPCVTEDSAGVFRDIRDRTGEIVSSIDLDSKTNRFPEAYLGDYDGQLGRIEYEWQTRRYPVSASVEETGDGRFVVAAGNTDEITDPLLDSGSREENKLRAEYVCAAVNGRNMKSGEEMSIQIPVAQNGVKELLKRLENDEQTVASKDISELEAEIDEAVYELFELSEDEKQVVEDFHEVF
ncbi:hypothetical protein HNR49_002243 [Halobacterium salinarum]|uniref:site-specific DNA-methyltransferase (adenine-specific) n=1 Tax=Halobacterium salinarum TaxID=2242 RepID=A0A841HDD5_HALSI|nr:N-6 DNA methylase [Halobacterium salinarum]MBB6090857.1 hypothetical protein [Halobacterium salinarum]